MDKQYDLIVIGAGPGGYEAALEAAALGMKTALIERRELGGACLNRGCIPTKALAHAAGIYAEMQHCDRFGLRAENVACDMERVAAYKNETIDALRGGIAMRMKQRKVTVYQGCGLVEAPHCVRFEPEDGEAQQLTAQYVLVAAGSKPAMPPIEGAQLAGVVTSDELLNWDKPVPETLLIIGGGVIGVEFASIFSTLGSRVIIVEALDRLLANLDKELGQSIKLLLKKRGVETHTGARVERLERGENNMVTCIYTEKDAPGQVQADLVLLAVGRAPCGLGTFTPECVPQTQRGCLVVDDAFCTSMSSVYAVGDAIGGMQLAHVATAQGLSVVRALAGKQPGIRLDVVPSCVYTEPEIASVGITAEEAKTQGLDVKSRKYVMSANGKSILTKQERGFMKVVYAADTRKVLGAQCMCARATDIIGEFATAIVNGLTMEQMAAVIRPHPTFCEAISELVQE